jgi:hypothetical protein
LGTPIKQYLIKVNIERAVMKAFLQMFDTNYQNVRVQKWEPNTVVLSDLMDDESCATELKEHFELFSLYADGRNEFKKTAWWKREYENAPKGQRNSFAQRRLDELMGLYGSIRKNGYVKKSGNLMKVIDIRNLNRKIEPEWKDRVTGKYYRLDGKRRCIICKYLEIEKIIVSVIKVRIVKL